jgi:hypothetical protein
LSDLKAKSLREKLNDDDWLTMTQLDWNFTKYN